MATYNARRPSLTLQRLTPSFSSARKLRTTGAAPRTLSAFATGALAVGGLALGAMAVGAVAVGALAIGRLAVGRLAVGRTRIGRLEIDELSVRRLLVTEELHVPPSNRSIQQVPEHASPLSSQSD